jgi:hypothetical protein
VLEKKVLNLLTLKNTTIRTNKLQMIDDALYLVSISMRILLFPDFSGVVPAVDVA